MTDTPTDDQRMRVLINDEEQHAIVPEDFPAPAGWQEAGFAGGVDACERWVEEHWPDIRPRSVREAIAAARTGTTGTA
ncbi:MbtH family NRPS accessory protein [Streptomyces sp. NPDC002763]|uniref:MbtH family protein n=1 Tax=Streptomyces sp. NPDC002763 TaxID=3154427 RepID=UPI00332C7E52